MPRLLWKAARIREVRIEGLDRLEALRGQRAVLTPNHPTRMDPIVMFELSRQLGEPFNYLASRETFSLPFFGMVFQKCGAYSVKRGAVDRQSIKTTRKILVKGERKIVMFPEGLVYGQNDSLMPFHEGVFKFGYWALQDMKKAGMEEPLYYVPIGIRYEYTKSMEREIESAMTQLEEYLKIENPDEDSYERLRNIGALVVAGYEAAYGVTPDKDATLDERVQYMKNLWVERAAKSLGISDDTSRPLGDRIRLIINTLDSITVTNEDASEFEKKTVQRRQRETEPLYKDLERASRFLATGANYVSEERTDQRFLEVISLIEEELFGYSPVRGPRRAIVKIGTPHMLRTNDGEDAKAALTRTTSQIEQDVIKLINLKR